MFIMKWTTWENISVMYSLLAHVLLARGHCAMHWGAALCATCRIMQRRRCAVEDSVLQVLYCTVLMLMFVCWCWCWCWLSCACPDVLVQHEHLHTSVSINCTCGQDILQPLWRGKLGHGCQRCPPIGTIVAAPIWNSGPPIFLLCILFKGVVSTLKWRRQYCKIYAWFWMYSQRCVSSHCSSTSVLKGVVDTMHTQSTHCSSTLL